MERRLDEAMAAPVAARPMRVEPGWIDYNGHMNMAYYVVLFDRTVDETFEALGLGPDYVATRDASFFTAEIHVRYLRELTVDTLVLSTMRLVAHDEKRIHAWFEIRHGEEGWLAATCEKLFLHVDMKSRKVVPFPTDVAGRLAGLQALHDRLPLPEGLGRSVTLIRKRAASP